MAASMAARNFSPPPRGSTATCRCTAAPSSVLTFGGRCSAAAAPEARRRTMPSCRRRAASPEASVRGLL